MPALRMTFASGLAVLAAAPASAPAAPPWSPPQVVAGTTNARALLTTPAGGRVLVTDSGSGALMPPAIVSQLREDGSGAGRQELKLAFGRAAVAGRDRIVVAGLRPARTRRATARAPVVVAVGRPGALGTPRLLPGTRGQSVTGLAADPASRTIAVVTSALRSRTLWVPRGGAFRRVLTFRPSSLWRSTAVAVGTRGDVLLAWQAKRTIHARHFSRAGRPGPVRTLGAGRESTIEASITDGGRMEVAWKSQVVCEGDAVTPAQIRYASAPRGRRFGRAVTVGRATITGTGRYVAAPGVRLEPAGGGRSVLAWTDYDGEHFRVRVADVGEGAVGTPVTLSPSGDDFVLGDLAVSGQGAVLVLSRSGTRGADPSGPQRVFGAVRAAAAPAFGPPELVSDAAPDAPPVAYAPAAAIDAAGRPLAAWVPLGQPVAVAVRLGP